MITDFSQRLLANPLEAIVDYYSRHLNDLAHSFLERNSLSADERLRVGFADRTLGKQMPEKRYKLGREVRTKLTQLGILKHSGHEALRGFVTLPLTDSAGSVTGLYGLRVDNHGKDQPQLTIGSGLFNAAALTSFDEIIVCASVLDAWTFYSAGHSGSVAIEGGQLKKEHFANVKRLLFADPSIDCEPFDGVEQLRIHFPDGMSVNEYAKLNGSIKDALGKRIRAASVVQSGTGILPVDEQSTTNVEDAPGRDTKEETVTATAQPIASPVPGAIEGLDVERSETEVTIRIETRRWRVRGLERNTTTGVMKINLMIFSDRNERFHVDTLDLYHSRSRRVYLNESAEETALAGNELRSDLGRVLLKLEELQEQQRTQGKSAAKAVELTDAERSDAMDFLKSDNLFDRILDSFDACGVVGERTGKLAGYLSATSRLLDKPLGLIIQSSSAAGKSALADAVLRFMPPEERFACSAMTSQSLYYLGNENLKHKILSIAEEEGVRDASYQLKLLQSEGHLSLVATSKETGTGRTATERYEVEGPVALVMTTTALDVDPELMNRCLVVSVDESAEQTQAIHALQRQAETLEGLKRAGERTRIETLHQNAQRLLQPLAVVNPYADQLGFIGNQARHRRDHMKYLTLIRAVTFLHQHQRKVKQAEINGKETDYIEVTRHDITLANMIADWALGRSIDELAGPTRRLLVQLYDWLRGEAKKHKLQVSEIQFTRREAREALRWSATPMRIHLERLCNHEYVVPHGGGRGKLCKYSLLYNGRGREGQPAMIGLIDPAKLKEPKPVTTPTNLTGEKRTKPKQSRG